MRPEKPQARASLDGEQGCSIGRMAHLACGLKAEQNQQVVKMYIA